MVYENPYAICDICGKQHDPEDADACIAKSPACDFCKRAHADIPGRECMLSGPAATPISFDPSTGILTGTVTATKTEWTGQDLKFLAALKIALPD